MTDTYQAIYDAVRSRISNGNIADIADRVMRDTFDFGHVRDIAIQEIVAVSSHYQRPSVLYRPVLSADGNMWCALYGEDLQSGIAGFGDTPDAAMLAFDKAWFEDRTP